MDVGITYEAVSEYVALDLADDPRLSSNAVLLGRSYNVRKDKELFRSHVLSRLWFTYRKSFKSIGSTNFTSDQGWGCTLRCGQMMLAEALMRKHLPAEWTWNSDSKNTRYMTILSKFLDLKDSPYSIHRIAAQGTDFSRKIGEWFGPNTIAHVLKKLTDLDSWSQIGVVVATDMAVIMKELEECCTKPFLYHTGKVCVEKEEENPIIRAKVHASDLHPSGTTQSHNERDFLSDYQVMSMSTIQDQKVKNSGDSASSFDLEDTTVQPNMFQSYANIGTSIMETHLSTGTDSSEGPSPQSSFEAAAKVSGVLRSVLVLIPLRLGNERFNPLYWEGLKKCLDMPQTVGIVGGRPRHALWFVGYRGDCLLYLDPHTTQFLVKTDNLEDIPDRSYHCSKTDMMHYQELDPSLALGFFCRELADVEDFCHRVKEIIVPLKPPLFEILPERPSYWKDTKNIKFKKVEPFLLVDADRPSEDDEFVLVELPEDSADKET